MSRSTERTPVTVTFTIEVDFNIITLTNAIPYSNSLAATGLLLGQLHQPVPSGRRQGPERLPAVLGRLLAQVDVHDALAGPRSMDRARRIRCTSMLPEATVEACE